MIEIDDPFGAPGDKILVSEETERQHQIKLNTHVIQEDNFEESFSDFIIAYKPYPGKTKLDSLIKSFKADYDNYNSKEFREGLKYYFGPFIKISDEVYCRCIKTKKIWIPFPYNSETIPNIIKDKKERKEIKENKKEKLEQKNKDKIEIIKSRKENIKVFLSTQEDRTLRSDLYILYEDFSNKPLIKKEFFKEIKKYGVFKKSGDYFFIKN